MTAIIIKLKFLNGMDEEMNTKLNGRVPFNWFVSFIALCKSEISARDGYLS